MFLLRLCLAVGLLTSYAFAQAPDASKTILEVELLTPGIGGNPLHSQRWREAFQTLGEGVRIRQPLPDDKPAVTESSRGPFRIIKVVGEIDRQGVLNFPLDRKYTLQQLKALQEWLNELKVYGAQGSPDGELNWGLNKVQFDHVVDALSSKIETSVRGKTLQEALTALPLPADHPINFSPDTRQLLADLQQIPLFVDVQGLSVGTGLAAVLAQYGLGYWPMRLPDQSIQLHVEPLSEISSPWKIGWDVEETEPRNRITPTLFQMVNTGFDEAPLEQVIGEISRATGVPILINQAACLAKGVDTSKVTVSYPFKKTAYAVVLRSAVLRSRLQMTYKLDEAGTPFILIAPFTPMPAEQ